MSMVGRLRTLRPEINMPVTSDELILERGRHMPNRFILPDDVVHTRSGQCYGNAWTMRNRRRTQNLRYCEGYVGFDRLPIPIHHGWLLNDNDEVVDPSVDQLENATYYGVEYKTDFALSAWLELKKARLIGIMPNLYMLRKTITTNDFLEGLVKL